MSLHLYIVQCTDYSLLLRITTISNLEICHLQYFRLGYITITTTQLLY